MTSGKADAGAQLAAAMEQLAEEACACDDLESALEVHARMIELVWSSEEPAESDQQRIMESLERMAESFARLGDPGAFHRTPARLLRVLRIDSIEDAREAFYRGSRSPQLPFVVNDPVRALRGKAAGLVGAVISLEEIEPEVVYLVESGEDGSDALVRAGDLALLDAVHTPED